MIAQIHGFAGFGCISSRSSVTTAIGKEWLQLGSAEKRGRSVRSGRSDRRTAGLLPVVPMVYLADKSKDQEKQSK